MVESWKIKKRLTKKEKLEKAETLAHSRNLYARKEGDHLEVKECLSFFLNEMKKGHWVITKRYEHLYRKAIRIFILDLFVANQLDSEMYLTYSRSKDDFSRKRRYGKMYLSYDPTMNVVEYLDMITKSRQFLPGITGSGS